MEKTIFFLTKSAHFDITQPNNVSWAKAFKSYGKRQEQYFGSGDVTGSIGFGRLGSGYGFVDLFVLYNQKVNNVQRTIQILT
jgi:hypothetical protein